MSGLEDINTIAVWLDATYQLEWPIQVQLLRSYTNDVYVVTTATNKYILKIYGINWRTQADIQYEVALLEHLAQKGLHIANAIAGKDTRKAYNMVTSKGAQYAVLFEYADGYKPQPPFSNTLYVAFGCAMARMHELSNDFATDYKRKSLDLGTIIEAPIKLALPLIENEEDRVFLRKVAQRVIHEMNALQISDLDWGPIHGDATLDNLHVTDDNQIVLYDFDSGGPGWRAADLQGWAYNNTVYAEKWEAFKQGYSSIRRITPHNLEAARYLSVAWLIWGLQIDLEHRILGQSQEKITEYFAMQIGSIRAQARLAFG
ncbi:MAG: phosphotransferase [Anaerolineae bacterium]|nr:phosphotransferase [Anaerolineae bacterium]